MEDKRLTKTSELPLERELLLAAAEETAPSGARRRVLARLGLLLVLPRVAAGSIAASAGASLRRAAEKLVAREPWSSKWGFILGLIGAAIAGAVIASVVLASAALAPKAVGQPLPAMEPGHNASSSALTDATRP